MSEPFDAEQVSEAYRSGVRDERSRIVGLISASAKALNKDGYWSESESVDSIIDLIKGETE